MRLCGPEVLGIWLLKFIILTTRLWCICSWNHPSIVQYEAFNEGDMVSHFDPKEVTTWMKVSSLGVKLLTSTL